MKYGTMLLLIFLFSCTTPLALPREPEPETIPSSSTEDKICKLRIKGKVPEEIIRGARAGCKKLFGPNYCLLQIEERGEDNYYAICRDRNNPGPDPSPDAT